MNTYFRGVIAIVGLSIYLCAVAIAEEPVLQDNVPDTHTVVKGDTLWDISATFLKNPWMWPEIWHVNTQIENPHLIYPGDVIRLIYMDGSPRLTLDPSGRLFKLSPKARVISEGEAIPTISLDKINSFLSRSRIVTEEELLTAPYVVSGYDANLLVGAGDSLYARGSFLENMTVYGIYRKGDEYVDPITKEKLGVQALDIGSAKLMQVEGEIGELEALRTREEIRIADRLLREEERSIDSTFYPSSPSQGVDGLILAVEGGVTQVGRMDIVVLNKGERDNIVAGNIMSIHKRGKRIRDRVTKEMITLPEQRAGLLMVFRVFEKVSLAIVLEAKKGIRVADKVKNP